MKKSIFMIVIIVAIVGFGVIIIMNSRNPAGLPVASLPDANPTPDIDQNKLSAKKAYSVALPVAKRFSSDSVLVDLNTTGVQADGKSRSWYALFYSASRKTNFKINIVAGYMRTEEGDKKKTDPIADGWIDSTDVAPVALPKFKEMGELSEPDYFIALKSGKNNKHAIWSMNCRVGENRTLTVDIDAVTGEFIKTRKSGIGW
jgi:hypothetical protein